MHQKQKQVAKKPKFGEGKFKFTISPDFDDPLMLVVDSEAVQKLKPKPFFGYGTVKGWISNDFDAPLEDFKDYM